VSTELQPTLNKKSYPHGAQYKTLIDQWSAMPELIAPEAIGKGWRLYDTQYRQLRQSPNWFHTEGTISARALEIADNILYMPADKNLCTYLADEIEDKLVRVLVARRVVLRSYQYAPHYGTLIQRLGYCEEAESEKPCQVTRKTTGAYRTYMSEIGLTKRTIVSPYVSGGLWPEEQAWLLDNYS